MSLLLAKVAIHTITCKFIVFHLRFLPSMRVSSDFIWFHSVFMMGGGGTFRRKKGAVFNKNRYLCQQNKFNRKND